MIFGNRADRAKTSRRRGKAVLAAESLEGRLLMAIDLVNTPNAPYGIQEVGAQAGNGVGWSVANVGDTNGDGYEDFVIGAPTIVPTNSGAYTVGSGTTSRAALIFGSRGVSVGNVDWAGIGAQLRTGDLNFLGNANQNNPINGQATFPYDGVIFSSSLNTNSQLGQTVAAVGDVNGDGLADFMIGAPGANDSNAVNNGAGRAYLVYGSQTLSSSASKSIDVDSPVTFTTNIITFVTSISGSRLGSSAAGVGDTITDSFIDIAVGAPGANYNSLPGSGAAYVISGVNLRSARTTTLNITGAGQGTGFPGITFTGDTVNQALGSSLAGGFNFDGDVTSANQQIADFVIGAPSSGAGRTYLVYGAITLANQGVVVNGINQIQINRIGNPATSGNVAGLVITGAAAGDQTGFSLASAGDFNQDGLGDFMIGSPRAAGTNGTATMIQGRSVTNRLVGTLTLGAIPSTVNYVEFVGASTGSLTGWSSTAVGTMNNDTINEIAIGSPGFNNNQGAVYLIPGNPDLYGSYNLANAESQPIAGTLITVSQSVNPAFLGSSVGGRLLSIGQSRTIDNDRLGDLIVGAAGYSFPTPGSSPPTSSRVNAGTVFGLEGIFLPLQTPVSTSISTTIGIGQAQGPFLVNATTPAALDIYVYSNTQSTPVFRPVTDIDPTTTVVGGVAFPSATVKADPKDENGDGIPDAILTITPRSNLNLANGTQNLTVTGRTTASAGNHRWTGTASITVTGSSGGGGGGGGNAGGAGVGLPAGFVAQTSFLSPYGSALVPPLASLSTYQSYKAIPMTVAMQQFLPERGWTARNYAVAHHKSLSVTQGFTSTHNAAPNGVHTLGKHVFTRGTFHPGKTIKFRHKVAVVPVNAQRQVF